MVACQLSHPYTYRWVVNVEFWQKVPSIVALFVNSAQILHIFHVIFGYYIICYYLCIQNLTIQL